LASEIVEETELPGNMAADGGARQFGKSKTETAEKNRLSHDFENNCKEICITSTGLGPKDDI
jgi:hypothetical protein